MRTPRTEIVSVDTARLAQHAFRHSGRWDVIVQGFSTSNGTLVAFRPMADGRAGAGFEYWLIESRGATRITARITDELFTIDELTCSRLDDGSILVAADLDQAEQAILNCAHWRHVKLTTKTEVDEHITDVEIEIKRALVHLQLSGALSDLNTKYKALRTGPRAEGEKLPSYKNWSTARLEAQILERLMKPAVAA